MSYVRNSEILNGFLASVNVSSFLAGIGSGESIFKLDNLLMGSSRSMYAPGVPPIAADLKSIVVKYFLLNLLRVQRRNSPEDPRVSVTSLLKSLKGKQYILFEIDLDFLRKGAESVNELVDEVLRIDKIERELHLMQVPKELNAEREDLL